MPQRLRVKHRFSFHKRLAMWAEQVREQAARLPIGPEREALLQKAAQAEPRPALTVGPTLPDFNR